MAPLNINVFEEGNSSLQTETSNSNTPHFTRVARGVVSFYKLRRIVITFLRALRSTFPVEGEFLCVSEKLLTDRNRNSQKKLHPCESRCLRLNFSHEVTGPVVYTGDCILPNGTTLELVDVVTGQVVRDVPLVSPQVEIFLLNDDENWTSLELNNHIWMPKRGRKSGRNHNPYLRLEGGIVSVDEIQFKHTRKHTKKLNMVRLGARIIDQPEEIEVKEAMTGSFTVKDKRLKSKKRFPPSPTDDVWRLEKIGINGAFHKQLTKHGITTVEDFSIELQNNPQKLFQIVGKSMPQKYWEEATTHAKSCNLDGRKYSYHHLETGQKFTVVFNVARQVMWLDSGYGLHHFNMLSESQKVYAHKLVETAFANWEYVEKSDNEISAVDHLPPSPPKHLGNLVMVGECKLQFQNTSGTTERVDKAECSTSYGIPDWHSEPDEMSLAITSPDHSGLGTWGYLGSPTNITSVTSESGDLKEFTQFLSSDEIQFDDFAYANSTSTIQFHELQHGEMTQNQFTQFLVSENVTNANEHSQMNNVFMVPEASTNPEKDIQPPKPRSLKLKFLTTVSDPVLTGVEIIGEGGNAIELALVDDNTGEIVESGPDASAKVEIVVLRGEFGDDNGGNWTVEEFCGNIVREREGKKSLLAETVHVRLNKGIGSIDKIKFTHSSIYMKTGMFRLGARIVDNFNNIQVKEARTESFTVKDGRQLYHEKHDPPSLSDGVQRLKNIGKCRNYRLRNESVYTVEDFLILLLKDSEQLKRVLNLKPKMLDETISQARRCIINERIFSYIDLQEKEGVVFNIVGEVKGLILGVQYLPMHLLSESDKANAQRLLVSACEHWDHVKQYDNETSLMQYLSQIVPTENPSNSPSGEVPSTSDSVENFRTSDEHCSTSFQHNVSAVIPARGASAISLNYPSSASINNLELSDSPIYSPSFHDLCINPCFENLQNDPCCENLLFGRNAHQPHDDSASKVNVHNRWKTLLKIFKRRRAAALTDSQPPKKQRVF